MYCKCDHPKKKTSEANGEKFTICAISLGGCGEEYLEGIIRKSSNRERKYEGDWTIGVDLSGAVLTPQILEQAAKRALGNYGGAKASQINPHLKPEMMVCPECDGGGSHMVCYGGMPFEKKCERCDGAGEVEDI
jgi:hypothetical protein